MEFLMRDPIGHQLARIGPKKYKNALERSWQNVALGETGLQAMSASLKQAKNGVKIGKIDYNRGWSQFQIFWQTWTTHSCLSKSVITVFNTKLAFFRLLQERAAAQKERLSQIWKNGTKTWQHCIPCLSTIFDRSVLSRSVYKIWHMWSCIGPLCGVHSILYSTFTRWTLTLCNLWLRGMEHGENTKRIHVKGWKVEMRWAREITIVVWKPSMPIPRQKNLCMAY